MATVKSRIMSPEGLAEYAKTETEGCSNDQDITEAISRAYAKGASDTAADLEFTGSKPPIHKGCGTRHLITDPCPLGK